jgi:hypothetical protein
MVLGATRKTTMTITHEAVAGEAPQAAKAPKTKKAKKPTPIAAIESAPQQPATDTPEPEKPAKRGKSKRPVPLITMKLLSERYIEHLIASGKSPGTAMSYLLDITTATKFLGEDTKILSITPDDVRRFNDSAVVMRKKNGQPKAAPSYLKSQRVLRLALVWAAEQGWIESAPIPTIEPK